MKKKDVLILAPVLISMLVFIYVNYPGERSYSFHPEYYSSKEGQKATIRIIVNHPQDSLRVALTVLFSNNPYQAMKFFNVDSSGITFLKKIFKKSLRTSFDEEEPSDLEMMDVASQTVFTFPNPNDTLIFYKIFEKPYTVVKRKVRNGDKIGYVIYHDLKRAWITSDGYPAKVIPKKKIKKPFSLTL